MGSTALACRPSGWRCQHSGVVTSWRVAGAGVGVAGGRCSMCQWGRSPWSVTEGVLRPHRMLTGHLPWSVVVSRLDAGGQVGRLPVIIIIKTIYST